MTIYFLSLALTLACEAIVVALLAPRARRISLARTSLLVNLFTHPLASLLAGQASLLEADRFPTWWLLEASVVVVEGLLYVAVAGCGPWRAAALTLAANVASAALSPLLR